MTPLETAAREELDAIVAQLRTFLDGTTPQLQARGLALAKAARDIGTAVIEKRITWEVGKGRLAEIADAVKSEALAAGYIAQAEAGSVLSRFATGLLRIASLALKLPS